MSEADTKHLAEIMDKHSAETILLRMCDVYKNKAIICRHAGQQRMAEKYELAAEHCSYAARSMPWEA